MSSHQSLQTRYYLELNLDQLMKSGLSRYPPGESRGTSALRVDIFSQILSFQMLVDEQDHLETMSKAMMEALLDLCLCRQTFSTPRHNSPAAKKMPWN